MLLLARPLFWLLSLLWLKPCGGGPMVNENGAFPDAGLDILRILAPPPREDRAKVSHYASGLVGCPRKDYFRWTAAPISNPRSESSKKKMEAGVLAHDMFSMRLHRHFDRHGEVTSNIAVELVDSRLEYPIHGYIDDQVDLQGVVHVVEYKSTQYRTTDRALEAPLDSGLLQLWAYMRAKPANHHYLVYEDRGSKLGVSYEVTEKDEQLFWRKNSTTLWTPVDLSWEAMIKKLVMIEKAVGSEEAPDRLDPVTNERYVAYLSKDGNKIQQTKTVDGETFRTHWMCMGYCEYRDHCWLGMNAAQAEEAEAARVEARAVIKKRGGKAIEAEDGKLSFDPGKVQEA